MEVSRKLEELSELQRLKKDVWRIAVALEKLAGIESQNTEEEQFSWPESKREEMQMQKSKEKGKQREERIDRVEKEEEVRKQKEKNGMEGVKEKSNSFFPVTYSVGTRTL